MNSRNYITINIIIPLILGILMYVLFRNYNLLFYSWIEYLTDFRLSESIQLDISNLSSTLHVPNWIKFSLPDGIWIYVFTSTIIAIWAQKINIMWLLIPLFLGITLEIAQLYNLILGTFDKMDIAFLVFGYGLALIIGMRWRIKCLNT